jgi:fumarate hydratase subunit beta
MKDINYVSLPLDDEVVKSLKIGDRIMLNGYLYTARDAAHKRMIQGLEQGKDLPFDIVGQTIFYVGPSPAKPGQIIGSAGPTTSYRMDPYTDKLLEIGLKGMIGKGLRSQSVIDSIKKNTAVYFAAVGGVAALIAKSILSKELVAYEDLGPEAIYKLEVKDFPVIVVIDCLGNCLYD